MWLWDETEVKMSIQSLWKGETRERKIINEFILGPNEFKEKVYKGMLPLFFIFLNNQCLCILRYEGLSEKFLSSPVPKLLLLAGTDRLDRSCSNFSFEQLNNLKNICWTSDLRSFFSVTGLSRSDRCRVSFKWWLYAILAMQYRSEIVVIYCYACWNNILWPIIYFHPWILQEDVPDEFAALVLNFISRNRIGPHGVEVGDNVIWWSNLTILHSFAF